MISKKQTLIDIDCLYKDEKYMPLLPLLEQAYQEVKETYPGISEENYQDLILYALDWQSEDHWQARSMDWLENGLTPSESILDKISDLSTNGRMSADLKQRMKSLIEKNSVEALA